MPDWIWWLPAIAIMAAVTAYEAWRRRTAYREIREGTARIGQPWTCPQCPHDEHPAICMVDRCGCDLMTEPEEG